MKRLKLILVLLIYIAVLVWAYVVVISPTFAYFGYKLYWPNNGRLAWMFALALAPTGFIPIRLSRPSLLVIWWLYVAAYIPSIVLPTLSLTLTSSQLLPLETALLLSMALMTLLSQGRPLALRPLRVNRRVFWPSVLFLWGVSLAFVATHFRLSSLIYNLASLFLGGSEYTIRNAFFDQLSQSGRILGYVTGQVAEGIDPFLIAYGLVFKRKPLLLAGVMGQLMIFAIVGSKSTLFSSAFLIVVFALMKRYGRNFGTALGCVLIAVILLSAGVDSMSKGILVSSVTTRRTLMDPGLLTGFYFEHYMQVPHAGLGYHFPKPGAAIPAPSYEIGLVYFNDVHVDANANLWAEGYADFGMAGVLIFTLILSLILWAFDSVAACRHIELGIMLITMQAFDYSNSAPTTTFLTHGGLASLLLLWAVPLPEREVIDEKTANEVPSDEHASSLMA